MHLPPYTHYVMQHHKDNNKPTSNSNHAALYTDLYTETSEEFHAILNIW